MHGGLLKITLTVPLKTFVCLGLEETDQGVWKLFTAVIIHSVAIVFCIGQFYIFNRSSNANFYEFLDIKASVREKWKGDIDWRRIESDIATII